MQPGDVWLQPAAANDTVTVTVLLKTPSDLSDQLLSGQYHPASREAAEQATAANPQDLAAVRQFAQQNGLSVRSEDAASRRVVLAGTVQQMDKAFGVEIGDIRDAAGHTFRAYRGSVQLPPALQNSVTAVLGLDQRPVARHAHPD